MGFCTSCGAVAGIHARFCSACGRALLDESVARESDEIQGRATLASLTATGRVLWPSYLNESDVVKLGRLPLPVGTAAGFIGVSVISTEPLKVILCCFDQSPSTGGKMVGRIDGFKNEHGWILGSYRG